jgi:hypothetical protein
MFWLGLGIGLGMTIAEDRLWGPYMSGNCGDDGHQMVVG